MRRKSQQHRKTNQTVTTMQLFPADCLSDKITQFINRIVLVGAGDVVKHKIFPALLAMAAGLRLRVALCGLEPQDPLNTLPHSYFQIRPGDELPLDELEENGFSGRHCLCVIATPSPTHIPYSLQALKLGARVAPEKPLAADTRDARRLENSCGRGRVFPIDHFQGKRESLELLRALHERPELLRRLARIEFEYFETSGFAWGRFQEDSIGDVLYHGLTLVAAVLGTAGQSFCLGVKDAISGQHRPDAAGNFQPARVGTASKIQAYAVMNDGRTIQISLAQAKGAPFQLGRLRLGDGNGDTMAEADLGESGHVPHQRVLLDLLQEAPHLPLSLPTHIRTTELVEAARLLAQAKEEREGRRFYGFREMPAFLRDGA